MSRSTLRLPKYRHHKAKGLAAVTIDGKHIYLDSPESHQKYRQVLADWLASKDNAGSAPTVDQVAGFWGVNNLIETYLAVAKKYYVGSDGKPTTEFSCMASALAPLSDLHGLSNAHEFGARKLKEVRSVMIGLGWARTVINAALSRIRRVFKWAVSEELLSPSILYGLQSVSGLRIGRSDARETYHLDFLLDKFATKNYLSLLCEEGKESRIFISEVTAFRLELTFTLLPRQLTGQEAISYLNETASALDAEFELALQRLRQRIQNLR